MRPTMWKYLPSLETPTQTSSPGISRNSDVESPRVGVSLPWSVMERKSYPDALYLETAISSVISPSELSVWVWRLPLNHLPSASKGFVKTGRMIDRCTGPVVF